MATPLQRVLALFHEATLKTQTGVVGVGLSLLVPLIVWASASVSWPWLASMVAIGLLVTGANVWLMVRISHGLSEVSETAQTFKQADVSDTQNMPVINTSATLRETTIRLRRMVDAMRQRQRALEALNEGLTQRLSTRTHELNTLQNLSIGLASKTDLKDLVNEALAALEQTVEYASASMWARNKREAGGQVVLLGYRTGESLDARNTDGLDGMRLSRANLQHYEHIERNREAMVDNDVKQGFFSWLWTKVIDDARTSTLYLGSKSWMALPLKFREEVLGVMRVDHHEANYFDDERVKLLNAVTSQTALAMRHAHLLANEKEGAVIAERNRIARDLHDAVSQSLFAANLIAGTLAKTLGHAAPPSLENIQEQAQTLEKLNQAALAEMRLLMFELRPDALQNTPLAELFTHAAAVLACRGEVVVEKSLANHDDFDVATRTHLFRIAQEALANISKHSGATQAWLEWAVHGPGCATLRIRDDGKGFDPQQQTPGHFGLENMQSRAQDIGAQFTLISETGEGTTICVELGAKENDT